MDPTNRACKFKLQPIHFLKMGPLLGTFLGVIMYDFNTQGLNFGVLLPAAVVNGALVFQLLEAAAAGVDQGGPHWTGDPATGRRCVPCNRV